MKENVIKQLSDVEHVLLRPGQYIGSTVLTKMTTFILNKEDKFEYKEIEYVPGFLKIIYEVLDNSVDEAIRTGFKYGNAISIDIDDTTISIKDNGRGIPLKKMENSDMTMLEGALTCLRAGSNFNDEDGRILLGMNGVGASLTNIFSKSFVADVYDGTAHGVLTCSDNMHEKEIKIRATKNEKTGTTITFVPDIKRFGLKKIDSVHIELVKQRIMFLSYTYPEIKFKFNGSLIQFKNPSKFMHAFSEKFVAEQGAKYLIGVIPNEMDEFCHKSYINGADCILGGNHLDAIHNELVNRIKDKLSKKYPSIKPGDIKNKLCYIINFREFVNPMFNSQTKESFSSPVNEIKTYLKDVNWDDFAQRICKCEDIIAPIVEMFKIKEELKNRQALDKASSTTKKFKCDKFFPATVAQRFYVICEGSSSCTGLMDGFGRKEFGYFASRGVPLNAYEVTPSRLAENEELTNIIKCLGIKLANDKQSLTYESIVLANDADFDGMHICGLYLAFFYKYTPSLLKNGSIKRLRTPVMCLKDKKGSIVEMFFTFDEYNDYLKKHGDNGKYTLKYYKGLGSWDKAEWKELVQKHGVERFIDTLKYDSETEKLIDDWIGKKNADVRKDYLRNNDNFTIFSI